MDRIGWQEFNIYSAYLIHSWNTVWIYTIIKENSSYTFRLKCLKNKQRIDIGNGGSIYQTKNLKSSGVAKKIEFIVDSLITTLDD